MSDKSEQFDDLEAALRQLPLQQPSAALDAKIWALAGRHGSHKMRWVIGFVGGGLAAAASLLIAFWPSQVPTASIQIASTAPVEQKIVEIVDSTEQWVDEGIVGYASNGPVRQYRIHSVEQYASADSSDEKTLYRESVVQVVSEAY